MTLKEELIAEAKKAMTRYSVLYRCANCGSDIWQSYPEGTWARGILLSHPCKRCRCKANFFKQIPGI